MRHMIIGWGIKLIDPLLNQDYHLFFDYFFTSVTLLNDLFYFCIAACGSSAENRMRFPANIKNSKQCSKEKKRGDMGWSHQGHCLCVQ